MYKLSVLKFSATFCPVQAAPGLVPRRRLRGWAYPAWARLTQVRSLLGQKIEATAEVTAIDPPNSLSFTSIGGGMINLLGTYLFDAMGGGTYSR